MDKRILIGIFIFSVYFISFVSADVQIAAPLGSSTASASNFAVGAYHWSCVNFTTTMTSNLNNITTYISDVSGLNVNTIVGIWANNATRGVNASAQVGSNSTAYNSFSVGYMNWTFPSSPLLIAGNMYWACWYVSSSNFIRFGENTVPTGQGIWASSSIDNLQLALDQYPGSIVTNLNIQFFGNGASIISPVNMTMVYPQNINYSSLVTRINITTSANAASCFYSLNNWVTNTSFTCGLNVTGLSSPENSSTWGVYAINSSGGQLNMSSVTFYVDTLYPSCQYVSPTPANSSAYTGNSTLINVTSYDTNLMNITLYLYNTTGLVKNVTTSTNLNGYNFTNLPYGQYFFNATAWDNFGHQNTTFTYNITLLAPVPLGVLNYSFDGVTNVTVNFLGLQNASINYSIYRYANITNVTINVSTNTYSCYQENANSATSTDGNCSLVYTGLYATPAAYFYINYTKPNYALNTSTWDVKFGQNSTYSVYESNFSIPISCWNYNSTKLVFRIYTNTSFNSGTYLRNGTSYGQCYDGSWNTVTPVSSVQYTDSDGGSITGFSPSTLYDKNWYTNAAYAGQYGEWYSGVSGIVFAFAQVYEEGMIWNISQPTLNPYILLNGTNIWNYSGSFTQSFNTTNDFKTLLKNILSFGACNGGYLNGNNCTVNFTVHSDISSVLSLGINFNWNETIKPLLTIAEPNESFSGITYVPINFTATDGWQLDNNGCYFNVTKCANAQCTTNTTDTSNTNIPGCQNTTFTVTGNANYWFNMCINDSFNNQNCSSKSFSIGSYVPPPATPPAGGGGTVVINNGNSQWTMSTDSNTASYVISMSPGTQRSKNIVFYNKGSTIIILNLKATGNASSYISFDSDKVTLPVLADIPTQSGFQVTVPENIPYGIYQANLIATDQNGNNGLITVIVDVGSLGTFAKLGLSKQITNTFFLPYWIISFLTGLILGGIVYFISKKNIPDIALALGIASGLVGFFAILFIV